MSFYHVQIVKCTSCKADRSRASHSAEEQSMILYLCWFGCSFLRDTFSPRVICHIYSCLHGPTMHKWHLSREWSTCQLTRGPKFKALYLQKTICLSVVKSVCLTTHPTPSTRKQKPGVAMHTSTEPEPEQAHLCEFKGSQGYVVRLCLKRKEGEKQ